MPVDDDWAFLDVTQPKAAEFALSFESSPISVAMEPKKRVCLAEARGHLTQDELDKLAGIW